MVPRIRYVGMHVWINVSSKKKQEIQQENLCKR